MRTLKFIALAIALCVCVGAVTAHEGSSLRTDSPDSNSLGLLGKLSALFNKSIEALQSLVHSRSAPVHVEEEGDLEFAGAIGDHFKHIAKLVRAVMREHANTAEIRKGLIQKSINTLRLDGLSENEIKNFFPGLKDDFDYDKYLIQIATCGSKNVFLDRFIKRVAYRNVYGHKTDIATVIPAAFSYMVTLDRLTSAARHNHLSLIRLKVELKRAAEVVPWKEYTNDFEQAKKLTIDQVVEEYTSMHKKKSVPDNWGRRTLPINICEAALEDYRLDFVANAEAGIGIAFERPGDPEYDPRTGAGPSKFSPDGMGIEYNLPLPEKYADSYSTWNMAFVSHYGDAPHFWAKLVNPAVFCYQDEPNLYLYNRVIALYIHIAAQMFDRADRQSSEAPYQWNDDNLTKIWAEENYESIYGTGGYLHQIYQETGEDPSWLKGKAQDIMSYFGQYHAEDVASLMKIGMELKTSDSWSLTDFLKIAKHGTRAVYLLLEALIWT